MLIYFLLISIILISIFAPDLSLSTQDRPKSCVPEVKRITSKLYKSCSNAPRLYHAQRTHPERKRNVEKEPTWKRTSTKLLFCPVQRRPNSDAAVKGCHNFSVHLSSNTTPSPLSQPLILTTALVARTLITRTLIATAVLIEHHPLFALLLCLGKFAELECPRVKPLVVLACYRC
jgi:hypothetical protein